MSTRINEQHLKPARSIVSYQGAANRVFASGITVVDFEPMGNEPPLNPLLRVHDGNQPGGIACAILYPANIKPAAPVVPFTPLNVPFTNVTSIVHEHGFARFPMVQVYSANADSGMVELIGAEIIQLDNNKVAVNFATPTTGFLVIH